MKRAGAILAIPAFLFMSANVWAAEHQTVWDLQLGKHARELPVEAYNDYACGTNGGPPSLLLSGWTEWSKCPAEAATGLHEVYFRYDDEEEYVVKAMDPTNQGGYVPQGTSEFQIPLIVSGLFDDNGFLVGIRVVSDPRTSPQTRERGYNLAGALRARFGEKGWTCEDLPKAEGETDYHGLFIKQHCTRDDPDAGVRRTLDVNFFRKPGQTAIDPFTGTATVGYFVSETRYQEILLDPIANPKLRMATLHPPEPTPVQLLAKKIHDCPGCDLTGAQLKRADLRDANLAGADLTGADLHGALLTGADLRGAKLPKANLNKTDLRRANLAGADLGGAMLYEAKLDGVDLTGADLSNVAAAHAQLILVKAEGLIAVDADFRFARLSNADFTDANCTDALFQDTQFARASLEGANLDQGMFTNASLTETKMAHATARGADFTKADLRGADLTAADFSGANLRLATLADVTDAGASFTGASMPPGFQGGN